MDLGDYPSLLIVTGTVQVRGGESRTMKSKRSEPGVVVTEMHRVVSDEKRSADVISVRYMKRIAQLRVAKTPFGNIVNARVLSDVKALIQDADAAVSAFNQTSSEVVLRNCIVWEPLRGNRLRAVQEWLEDNPELAARIVEAA